LRFDYRALAVISLAAGACGLGTEPSSTEVPLEPGLYAFTLIGADLSNDPLSPPCSPFGVPYDSKYVTLKVRVERDGKDRADDHRRPPVEWSLCFADRAEALLSIVEQMHRDHLAYRALDRTVKTYDRRGAGLAAPAPFNHNEVVDRQRHNADEGMVIPPDPVIDEYKRSVDRTLIREQLRRSIDERVQNMIAALRLVEELHAAYERRMK
jgi:hypothetical protein